MEGLNKEFMKDPKKFLTKYPIDIPNDSDFYGGVGDVYFDTKLEGVYDFDLQAGKHGFTYLKGFAERGKKGTAMSNPIKAHWLPWQAGKTRSMVLDDSAAFFFTSALGGCRFQYMPGKEPVVMHIAADMTPEKRDAQAKEVFKKLNIQGDPKHLTRRFSQRIDYPRTELAFVVGFFDKAKKSWRFYAQGIEVNPKTGIANVGELREGGNEIVMKI